jgi:hypothetical protein
MILRGIRKWGDYGIGRGRGSEGEDEIMDGVKVSGYGIIEGGGERVF